MQDDQIRKTLKPVIWDHDIDPLVFYHIALGIKRPIGFLDSIRALVRILERLSWYDVLSLFGLDGVRTLITDEVIKSIRFKEIRERYEFIQGVLHGKAVSFSGWDPEYRKRIRHTLLSDRWYSTEQGIF
ncbi:MAG: hypothetical protein PHQ23_03380 [Candidatus Wallbacteria bacterium]|nr:hypothetical protein [Candidatus Wallbacteria bacterium]